MSWRFRGNISGVVDSEPQSLAMAIDNFLLVNKTGGAVGVNVYMVQGIYQICIAPLNKQLASGETYESVRQVVMLATEKIRVSSSGSVDYDFTISNMNP